MPSLQVVELQFNLCLHVYGKRKLGLLSVVLGAEPGQRVAVIGIRIPLQMKKAFLAIRTGRECKRPL